MMDTSIADFRTSLYIPEMKKIAFQLPHVRIIGNNCCGNTFRKVFTHLRSNQYMLCHCDHAERVVASFAHQIQSG